MSDLIQELYNKGIDVGKEQGIAIGEAMGEARGEVKTLIKNINSLLKNGMPLENVLSALEVSKGAYEEALQIVKSLDTGK